MKDKKGLTLVELLITETIEGISKMEIDGNHFILTLADGSQESILLENVVSYNKELGRVVTKMCASRTFKGKDFMHKIEKETSGIIGSLKKIAEYLVIDPMKKK